MNFSKYLLAWCAAMLLSVPVAHSATYAIDIEGGHAAVNFKFKHLGYSVLSGTFEKFDGEFDWDPGDVAASRVSVDIDTKSLNSHHAERDRHIRGDKYLDVKRYPQAGFVSTRVEQHEDGNMKVFGELTLRGVTKEIAIDVAPIGAGNDPWGGYRAGFEGYVTIDMRDFGVKSFIPLHTVEMELFLEGIRQ
jgi:polyisoprenoid-binding protein YceI